MFAENSQVFYFYADCVIFYWERKLENVKPVLRYLDINVVINPFYLFVFYNIYFKLFIGAFYYERNYVLQNTDLDDIHVGLAIISRFLPIIQVKHFPIELRYFINDINHIYFYSMEDFYNNSDIDYKTISVDYSRL